MKTIFKSKGRANRHFSRNAIAALIQSVKLLIALMMACSAFGQTHVHFPLAEFNASPTTNRIVEVQPLTPFRGNVVTYNTGTNSYFFLSNALAADYGITIKQRGSSREIPFQVTVLSTNLGVIGAYTNTSVAGAQTYPTSGKAAWSILASDARYTPHGTAGVSVAAGTNAVATTNGNLVTISGTASPVDSLNGTVNSDDAFIGFNFLGGKILSAKWGGDEKFSVTDTGGVLSSGVITSDAGFVGDGSGLTNLNVAASIDPRITSSSGTMTVTSNTLSATTISATTVNATTVNGNGAGLTALNASQLASGTVPTARLDAQLQNFVSSDSVRAGSGSLEVGGQTSSDTVDFIGALRGKGTLLTNSFGVLLAPTNAGTVGQVPTLTADGVSMAFASVAGIGDLQAVNNLADVASTGQSRTNLGAHNADNLTRGTVAAARLPDLSTVYIATSTGNGTNTTLRSPVVLSELATNGINSSALIITSSVVNSSFIGTSNNTPLKLSVDSEEALVLERKWPLQNIATTLRNGNTNQSASGAGILSGASNTIFGSMRESVIAGGKYNSISGLTNSSGGALQYELGNNVIGGGMSNSITYNSAYSGFVGLATIGGGANNTIYDNGADHQVIAGGFGNTLTNSPESAIGGGYQNKGVEAMYGTISGGYANSVSNNTAFYYGTVGGGVGNIVSGSAATVPGGYSNVASGTYSMASGANAKAIHASSFVWGDGSSPSFASTRTNQFLILSTNGVGINTNNPGTNSLSVSGNVLASSFGLAGGSINSWDDVTNYFTQTGGSSLQTGNSTDATNINLTVTGTLIANNQSNTTFIAANAYFPYTNAGATFDGDGKLTSSGGVTQSGLAAGAHSLATSNFQFKAGVDGTLYITNNTAAGDPPGILIHEPYGTNNVYILFGSRNTSSGQSAQIRYWPDHASSGKPELVFATSGSIAFGMGQYGTPGNWSNIRAIQIGIGAYRQALYYQSDWSIAHQNLGSPYGTNLGWGLPVIYKCSYRTNGAEGYNYITSQPFALNTNGFGKLQFFGGMDGSIAADGTNWNYVGADARFSILAGGQPYQGQGIEVNGILRGTATPASLGSSTYVLDYFKGGTIVLNAAGQSAVTFSTTNFSAYSTNSESLSVILKAGASPITVTYPAWNIKSNAPTTIPASTFLKLNIESVGVGETNKYVDYWQGYDNSIAASYNLYTNYATTTAVNAFSGLVGMTWTNSVAGLTVTHLGRWVISGNSQLHTNYLVKMSTDTIVASNVVNCSGAPVGQFLYATCVPVALEANTRYTILTSEISGGDQYYDSAAGSAAVFSSGSYGQANYGTPATAASAATADNTISINRPYGAVDVKYTLP